jgi:hypothetical protein
MLGVWNTGILEYWNTGRPGLNGVQETEVFGVLGVAKSIIPAFHYSIHCFFGGAP